MLAFHPATDTPRGGTDPGELFEQIVKSRVTVSYYEDFTSAVE